MIIANLLISIVFAQQVSGEAAVIDGDTLAIGEIRVRLHGIDAPESSQWCQTPTEEIWACGEASTAHLLSLIGEQEVRCEVVGSDRYGREIGVCYSSSVNLNSEMVRSGNALAYRQYSTDFVEVERTARMGRYGMWSGRFVAPWAWRRGERTWYSTTDEEQHQSTTRFIDRDCGDFATWEEAQEFFIQAGPGDPHRLDGNRDGIACNALRRR